MYCIQKLSISTSPKIKFKTAVSKRARWRTKTDEKKQFKSSVYFCLLRENIYRRLPRLSKGLGRLQQKSSNNTEMTFWQNATFGHVWWDDGWRFRSIKTDIEKSFAKSLTIDNLNLKDSNRYSQQSLFFYYITFIDLSIWSFFKKLEKPRLCFVLLWSTQEAARARKTCRVKHEPIGECLSLLECSSRFLSALQ